MTGTVTEKARWHSFNRWHLDYAASARSNGIGMGNNQAEEVLQKNPIHAIKDFITYNQPLKLTQKQTGNE